MPFGIDPKQVAQVLANVAAIKGRLDVMDAKLDAFGPTQRSCWRCSSRQRRFQPDGDL